MSNTRSSKSISSNTTLTTTTTAKTGTSASTLGSHGSGAAKQRQFVPASPSPSHKRSGVFGGSGFTLNGDTSDIDRVDRSGAFPIVEPQHNLHIQHAQQSQHGNDMNMPMVRRSTSNGSYFPNQQNGVPASPRHSATTAPFPQTQYPSHQSTHPLKQPRHSQHQQIVNLPPKLPHGGHVIHSGNITHSSHSGHSNHGSILSTHSAHGGAFPTTSGKIRRVLSKDQMSHGHGDATVISAVSVGTHGSGGSGSTRDGRDARHSREGRLTPIQQSMSADADENYHRSSSGGAGGYISTPSNSGNSVGEHSHHSHNTQTTHTTASNSLSNSNPNLNAHHNSGNGSHLHTHNSNNISHPSNQTSIHPTPSDLSTVSNISDHHTPLTLQSLKQKKGLTKKKRKEYQKNPRYTPLKRVIEDLQKYVGPLGSSGGGSSDKQNKRKAALQRALHEFNHDDGYRHAAELYLGAANVLCLVLSMLSMNGGDSRLIEEEVGGVTSALEMVYRAGSVAIGSTHGTVIHNNNSKDGQQEDSATAGREAVILSYQDVGAALVPLLLRSLAHCEKGRKSTSSSSSSHADAVIGNITKVLLHMSRISELRVALVAHPDMLPALERVGTLPPHILGVENRVLRMRLLANLANSEGNKVVIFERSTLLESILKIATLDKSENAREYASAILMDLASYPANQMIMARNEKVIATFVKLAVVDDKAETREYAISGLQNLAFEKKNRLALVTYGKGVVLEALKKASRNDSNDKTRRRSAGALTNLACDETAEIMGSHSDLLSTLARVSVSDVNQEVQQRAALALTKLGNSITVKMSCWDALLDALLVASECRVADGIVSAMFRVKTRGEENRVSMANHPKMLEVLAGLCLRTKEMDDGGDGSSNGVNGINKPNASTAFSQVNTPIEGKENVEFAYKDCENATKAIAHLANDPHNHKLICNQHILAALVHGASLHHPLGKVTRGSAILALERMAMEHSNRPMMARYPGMLVVIAQATEREMNEESGMGGGMGGSVGGKSCFTMPGGQPRLAKPLLMSLLVAM